MAATSGLSMMVMPHLQQLCFASGDQCGDFADIPLIIPKVVTEPHWAQPELSLKVAADDVNMGRFVTFVGIEANTVIVDQDEWHGANFLFGSPVGADTRLCVRPGQTHRSAQGYLSNP